MHCIDLHKVIFVLFGFSYIYSISAWNKIVDLLYVFSINKTKVSTKKKYNNSPFDMVSSMPGDGTWAPSQYKSILSMYGVSIIMISQLWECIFLIVGIPILVVSWDQPHTFHIDSLFIYYILSYGICVLNLSQAVQAFANYFRNGHKQN